MQESESELITREHARTIAEESLNRGVELPDHSSEDIAGVYNLREIR